MAEGIFHPGLELLVMGIIKLKQQRFAVGNVLERPSIGSSCVNRSKPTGCHNFVLVLSKTLGVHQKSGDRKDHPVGALKFKEAVGVSVRMAQKLRFQFRIGYDKETSMFAGDEPACVRNMEQDGGFQVFRKETWSG